MDWLLRSRDLLKEVVADVEIVEDLSFKRRADRALAEYDGVVEPGQDIVYEYRWQEADGTWSSWRRTPMLASWTIPPKLAKLSTGSRRAERRPLSGKGPRL